MATVVIQPIGAAGHDSHVDSFNPTANYGTGTFLRVGKTNAGNLNRSLIKMSSIDLAGESVDTATLACYTSSVGEGNAYNFSVHEITSAWTASTVTWATQPTYDPTALATTSIAFASAWFSWNVSALVGAWYRGAKTNLGVLVKAVDESPGSTNKELASADAASNQPKLTIVTLPRPTVTITTMNGTQASPTASNNDVTPNLSGVFAQAQSHAMTHRQHIIYDELGNTVWDSGKTAQAAASGATITVTAPGTYLRYGRKYKWKWMAWDANGGYSVYSDFGWFRPTLTTTAVATDLAAGDHLYAMTPTGRIVALEEGTTNLGTAFVWRETFAMPMQNPLDWLVPTLYLTRVLAKIELPVGSTASVYYSTALTGTDWETAFALTPAAGVQVVDIAVPFASGDDLSSHEFRLKLSGTGPHKLFALAFEYEERGS